MQVTLGEQAEHKRTWTLHVRYSYKWKALMSTSDYIRQI